MDLLRFKEVILLPALVAWLATGGRRPLWASWLGAQLIAAVLTEGGGLYTRIQGIPNHGIYNAYMMIEFATLWGMVGAVPLSAKLISRLCLLGFGATAVLWMIDLSLRGTVHTISTNTLIVGGALLAAAAAGAVFLYMRGTYAPLHQDPLFWALLSTVAYFMCFVPTFGLYNYLSAHNPALASKVLLVNDLLFLLRYLLVCVSLVLLIRHARSGTIGP